MSQEELHNLINNLKDELNDLKLSKDTREEISTLVEEIELESKTLENKIYKSSLLESIQMKIEKFETEHPRITNILNEIMMKFSNIGI